MMVNIVTFNMFSCNFGENFISCMYKKDKIRFIFFLYSLNIFLTIKLFFLNKSPVKSVSKKKKVPLEFG